MLIFALSGAGELSDAMNYIMLYHFYVFIFTCIKRLSQKVKQLLWNYTSTPWLVAAVARLTVQRAAVL